MRRPSTKEIARRMGTTTAQMARARRVLRASRHLFTAVHMGVLTLDQAEAVMTETKAVHAAHAAGRKS